MEDKTDAFIIFEGGGAKGLAHAGALKAAEEKFKFIGVAGTSAGSIIAALVAAGFTADEIFSKDNPGSLLNINLTELLDKQEWNDLRDVRDRIDVTSGDKRNGRWTLFQVFSVATLFVVGLMFALLTYFMEGYWLDRWILRPLAALISFGVLYLFLKYRIAIAFVLFAIQKRQLLYLICRKRGVLSTEIFRKWLDEKLCERLKRGNSAFKPSGQNNSVTFGDLKIDLKIIASNVRSKRIRVFQSSTDIGLSVADAVCASISIPIVFTPKQIGNAEYVDGGIMSNFPVWVFDRERLQAPRLTPTIGLRLIAQTKKPKKVNHDSFLAYLGDIGYSAFFGDNTLETRNVATFHETMLRVKIGILDFDIDSDQREAICDAAFLDARNALTCHVHRVPEGSMDSVFKILEQVVRSATNHHGHLRMSVMLPIDNQRLEIVYSWNMDSDDDTDDQLVLGSNQGASGRCWQIADFVVCDLEAASIDYAKIWKMDKRQQRLVRKTLKSLCCVPILDKTKLDDTKSSRKSALIGVLCIDSDDNVVDQFSDVANNPQNLLIDCAAMIAERLTSWKQI